MCPWTFVMGTKDDTGALNLRGSLAVLSSRKDTSETQGQTGSAWPPCLAVNLPASNEEVAWVVPSGTFSPQTSATHLMMSGQTWSKVE